jgi:hypothetical protein
MSFPAPYERGNYWEGERLLIVLSWRRTEPGDKPCHDNRDTSGKKNNTDDWARTVPSRTRNLLSDMKLCKRVDNWTLTTSYQEFGEYHIDKLCRKSFQCRRKPPPDAACLRRLALFVPPGLRGGPPRNGSVRSRNGSSTGDFNFLVPRQAYNWPLLEEFTDSAVETYWGIAGT